MDKYFSYYDFYQIVLDFNLGSHILKNENHYLRSEDSSISYLGPKPRKGFYLGDSQTRICRFCKKSKPEVSFKKDAHALPELIGNDSIFSYYECDSCNLKFAKHETHLSSFLGKIGRTAFRVKGKRGYPKYKSTDENTILTFDGEVITIEINEESEAFEHSFQTGKGTFKGFKDSYIPASVYKCLAKIALTLMPEYELKHFEGTLNWINDTVHDLTKYRISMPFYLGHSSSFPYVTPLRAILLRRKNNSGNVPYMMFVLTFSSFLLQIYPPFCNEDSLLVNKTTENFSVYPIFNCFHPYRQGGYEGRWRDFSSIEPVKKEEDLFDFKTWGKSYRVMIPFGEEMENYLKLSPMERQKYEEARAEYFEH
jgi:hypothetical protein